MNVNVADVEISPIELEIIYNALTAAAAEMDVTIWRTSRSTIVRELLDYSTAIFDRDGWNVAQAARIPSHLNSMSYFLTEILARHIPPDRWGPDDIVISNDPYCGGQHLPDIVAYKAVFATAGASGSSERCVTISTSGVPHRAVMARARRRFFRKACEYRR